MKRLNTGIAMMLLAVTANACGGGTSGGNSSSGGDGDGGDGGTNQRPPRLECDKVEAGPSIIRRLTNAEYNKTVHDLLGDTTNPASTFVADSKVGMFENNAYSPITTTIATQYAEAAELLAGNAIKNMGTLVPCTPATGSEDVCARQFINTFGKKAFRRPLTSAEETRYLAFLTTARTAAGGDWTGAVRLVVQAILQSPNFLNHIERGEGKPLDDNPDIVALTQYEIASRLSYFLLGTMPDAALFAAADDGKLATAAGIETQVRRLIEGDVDARVRAGVQNFFTQWLGVGQIKQLAKSFTAFPEWTPELQGAVQGETEAFIDDLMWSGDARLHTFLTAPYSFVNAPLAELYGVPDVTGSALVRADLDPKQRAGILSHASILATNAHSEQTSPVHRGKFVRERFMCQDMPSPPPQVDVTPPKPDPSLTTRQRFARHNEEEYCANCHKLMDPIGLGFEKYDPIGKFRLTENDLKIDATGEIVLSEDIDGEFDGLIELTDRLAGSAQVRDCVGKQWFGYAAGRGSGFSEDACSIQTLNDAFAKAKGDFKELIVAVTRSDGFRFRKVEAPEVCQ